MTVPHDPQSEDSQLGGDSTSESQSIHSTQAVRGAGGTSTDSKKTNKSTEPAATDAATSDSLTNEESSFDDEQTHTYQTTSPHIQDQTVISDGPIAAPPGSMSGAPLQLRDIGKALAGQQLGHFVLEEFVGGGGMGAVFRATDTQLERVVAVKVLTNRYGGRAETVRRFRVEAQSAARLNHENIARVYFVGEDQGWNFIVFEFIEGENVRDLVAREGRMDVSAALSCTAQVASALQHAAEREVVHRDIKPSNVLLAPDGRAKLVDMGLARLRQVESSDDDLTVSGVTLGTFDYISPEQGRDPRSADVRSDLYSLGCTLYYMLTGEAPYPEGTVLQKLLSHTSDPAPDPRTLRSDIPDDVAALTLRLLEKDPADRYQQPRMVIRDIVLAAQRNNLTLGVKPNVIAGPAVAAPSPIRRSLPLVLPTIVLLLSVFAADAFLDSSGGATNSLPKFRDPESTTREARRSDANATAGSTVGDGGILETGIDGLSWPLGSRAPEAEVVETDLSELGSTEFPTDPFFPGLGGTSGKTPNTFPESSGVSLDGLGAVQESIARAAGVAASPRSDARINASVDIVVAQATELTSLQATQAAEGGDYQVVGTLPEALAIAAMRPELSHIQLRTNYARIVQSLEIRSDRLLISAAEGYEPIIRFAPEDNAGFSSSTGTVGMINIEQGSVRFEGVHFELDTRSFTRACSLFVIRRAELLSLSDSWVRIVGDAVEVVSYDTSFVSVAPVKGAVPSASTESDFGEREVPTPEIRCRNVVFGGEATILSVPEGRPLRMAWSNGFVATSRAFAEIGGVAASPGEGDQIVIDLDQMTAIIDQGMCRSAASDELSNLLTVDLHTTRSILVSPESRPLLVSIGHAQNTDQLESHILFNGERNFYEGPEIFWEKMQLPRSGVPLKMPIQLDFEEWQSRWQTEERRWHRNRVLWKTADDPTLPRHLATPSDYLLSDAPNNPARRAGGGVERSDAGFQASQLPSAPSELR